MSTHHDEMRPDIGAHGNLRPIAILASLLVIAVYIIYLYSPELIGGNNLQFVGDAIDLHLAWPSYLSTAFKDGHWPWWCPYWAMGFPYFSEMQTAVFYPSTWISVLLFQGPLPYRFLTIDFIVHLIIISWGTYAFALAVTRKHLPALIAAFAFPLCGFYLERAGHFVFVHVLAWMPWCLLAVRQAALRISTGWATLAILFLLISFLAGHGQMFAYVCQLSFAYAALIVLSQWCRERRQRKSEGRTYGYDRTWFNSPVVRAVLRVLLLGIILGLFILCACYQAMPMYELLKESNRPKLSFEAAAGHFFVDPRTLYAIAIPALRRVFPFDHTLPLIAMGGCVTALILLSLMALRRSAEARIWWMISIIALLATLGRSTPVYEFLFNYVPLMNRGRFPERLIWIFQWSGCITAAIGVRYLMDALGSRGSRRALWILGALVPLAAICFVKYFLLSTTETAPGTDPMPAHYLIKLLVGDEALQKSIAGGAWGFEDELRRTTMGTAIAIALAIIALVVTALRAHLDTPSAWEQWGVFFCLIMLICIGYETQVRIKEKFRVPVPQIQERIRPDGTIRYRIAELWDKLGHPQGRIAGHRVRQMFLQNPPPFPTDDVAWLGMSDKLPSIEGDDPFLHERYQKFMVSNRTLTPRFAEITRLQHFWYRSEEITIGALSGSDDKAKPWGGLGILQNISWPSVEISTDYLFLLTKNHYGHLPEIKWDKKVIGECIPESKGPFSSLCLALSSPDYEDLGIMVDPTAQPDCIVRVEGRVASTGETTTTVAQFRAGPANVKSSQLGKMKTQLPASLLYAKVPYPGGRDGYDNLAYAHTMNFSEPIHIDALTIEPTEVSHIYVWGVNFWSPQTGRHLLPRLPAIGFKHFADGKDFHVYRYEKELPTLTWAGAWEEATRTAKEHRIARIFAEDFNLDTTVLVERSSEPADGSLKGDPTSSATISNIRRPRPERIECEIDTDKEGFLVHWEMLYEGWKAYIDGTEVKVSPANCLFAAIQVPPGKHKVVLEFKPPRMKEARMASLSGLGGLFVLALVGLYQRRRSRMNGGESYSVYHV